MIYSLLFKLFSLFPIGLNGAAILGAIFWVWIVYDCVSRESSEGNDKLAWLLVILMLPLLGALMYYFVRRPKRISTLGQ